MKIVKQLAKLLPDTLFLKMFFKMKLNKKLRLRNTITFNEKLQWLKLYDRNPLYTKLVDKYKVKKYIAEKIGEEYIIPTLGVWEKFDDINFDLLPDKFVLKTNHGCGGIYICKDKSKLDIQKAKDTIEESLKQNYYKLYREWPYKNVKPRIIAEKYMVDESGIELKDYKFFCFNGEVKAMFVASERGKGTTKFDFFDADFKTLDIKQRYPNSDKVINKPIGFEKMKEYACLLSKGFAHVRVDFYNINGKIYFGELTFYHFSGLVKFEPEEWDKTFGDWIDLTKAYNYEEENK